MIISFAAIGWPHAGWFGREEERNALSGILPGSKPSRSGHAGDPGGFSKRDIVFLKDSLAGADLLTQDRQLRVSGSGGASTGESSVKNSILVEKNGEVGVRNDKGITRLENKRSVLHLNQGCQ